MELTLLVVPDQKTGDRLVKHLKHPTWTILVRNTKLDSYGVNLYFHTVLIHSQCPEDGEDPEFDKWCENYLTARFIDANSGTLVRL